MLKKVLVISMLLLIFTLASCDKKTPEVADSEVTPGPGVTDASGVTGEPEGVTDLPVTETEDYEIIQQSYLDKEKEITITYPAVSGLSNTGLQDSINEVIKYDALKFLVDFGTDEEDCFLDMRYEIKWKGINLLSIVFTGEEFHPGMPHPNNLFVATNINMKDGKTIKLSDVIQVSDDFINKYITEGKYAAPVTTDDPAFFDYIYSEPLTQLNTSNIGDNYIYFTGDSLGISTEVPYAMGGYAQYEVKYQDLLDFMNQDNAIWKDFSGVFTQANQNAVLSKELIQPLIPQNWKLLSGADGNGLLTVGDLNNDGVDDAAFIIEKESGGAAAPRTLIIALGKEDGSFAVSLTDEDIILRADEGGVWGDPVDSIVISRESLFLYFYGGSSWRWANSYEFKYLEDDWFLVGAKEEFQQNTDTGIRQGTVENYDFLAGTYAKTETAQDGTVSQDNENISLPELIRLKDFDIRSADKYKTVIRQQTLNALSEGGLYESKALGFSFVIPDSWGGKYAISEDSNSLTVYFVPKDLTDNIYGNFFTIIDKSALEYEDAFEYVGDPREFEAGGKTYVTGGPTDVGFSDTHAEFADYIKMREDIPSILQTIKPISSETNETPDFSLEEIKQLLLTADSAVDEIVNEETMGQRVIGKVDSSIVMEDVGDYPTFDDVMQVLGEYYTDEIAERELYRRNIADIFGQVGHIAADGENYYGIRNKSKISLVKNDGKIITVEMEAYDEDGGRKKVEFTLEWQEDGRWLITGEKGFIDDGYKPVKKKFLLDRFSVEASSQQDTYLSEYAADEDSDTAWSEGVQGDGINEWLLFKSETEQKVTGIEIINGCAKTLDLYNQNNRIKKIRIELSDHSTIEKELEDGNEFYQSIDFNRAISTSYIKITILEVYPGSTNDYTCISEVRIY